jgi:hypothetical protein
LKLDPNKFEKTRDTDTNIVTYSNEETGVFYQAYNGMVTHILYHESAKTCEKLEKQAKDKSK